MPLGSSRVLFLLVMYLSAFITLDHYNIMQDPPLRLSALFKYIPAADNVTNVSTQFSRGNISTNQSWAPVLDATYTIQRCTLDSPMPSVVMPRYVKYKDAAYRLPGVREEKGGFWEIPQSTIAADKYLCEGEMLYSVTARSWQMNGIDSMKSLPVQVLSSAQANKRQSYREISSNVQKGRPEWAVHWTSQEYVGGNFTNNPPGVLKLNNARYYPEGWAHDCKYFTAFTGKGCRPFEAVSPMCYGNRVPCLQGCDHVLSCQPGHEKINPSLPKHGSVVTISQVLGDQFYHFLAEGLTRAMPLLEMILDDKNILVHTYNTAATFVTEAMMLIGVPRERLIQGHGCANVLYIPEPVGCGGPSFEMLHMLRRRLRHELKCPSPRLDFPMQIVFIKRKGSRAVGNHYAIKTRLEESLKPHNLIVREHYGTGLLKDQWDLFASSVGVIGPHGAGLANMIVMKAHSVVVEFVVVGKDLNLCYLTMAVTLQHVYRAVVPLYASQYQAMKVDPETAASTMNAAIRYRLQLVSSE